MVLIILSLPKPQSIFLAMANFEDEHDDGEQNRETSEPEEHYHLTWCQFHFVRSFPRLQNVIRANPFAKSRASFRTNYSLMHDFLLCCMLKSSKLIQVSPSFAYDGYQRRVFGENHRKMTWMEIAKSSDSLMMKWISPVSIVVIRWI